MKKLKVEDLVKLKAKDRVRLKDGEGGPVRGCYMTSDGIMVFLDTRGTGVCRNVLLADLVDAEVE